MNEDIRKILADFSAGYDRLIERMESDNARLLAENQRLRKSLEPSNPFSGDVRICGSPKPKTEPKKPQGDALIGRKFHWRDELWTVLSFDENRVFYQYGAESQSGNMCKLKREEINEINYPPDAIQ